MSGFALVLGITHEPPVAAVARQLSGMNLPHLLIDQRLVALGDARTWWDSGSTGGVIDVDGSQISLDEVTGVYTRLTTWADLPNVGRDPAALHHASRVHQALESWLEATSACVINRTSANDTNNSKPYQTLLIREHFDIPATLVSNNREDVLEFRQEFGRIIYKSISGERSIVTSFTDDDLDRLPLLANAPTQFQEHVSGVDLRVHVVGSGVFATRVESDAIDYRYDHDTGGGTLTAFDLPKQIAAECVTLTRRLGLELSGIDLRLANDGRVVCFEVNPSPAFTAYEDVTGQPIAAAIARRLSRRFSSAEAESTSAR